VTLIQAVSIVLAILQEPPKAPPPTLAEFIARNKLAPREIGDFRKAVGKRSGEKVSWVLRVFNQEERGDGYVDPDTRKNHAGAISCTLFMSPEVPAGTSFVDLPSDRAVLIAGLAGFGKGDAERGRLVIVEGTIWGADPKGGWKTVFLKDFVVKGVDAERLLAAWEHAAAGATLIRAFTKGTLEVQDGDGKVTMTVKVNSEVTLGALSARKFALTGVHDPDLYASKVEKYGDVKIEKAALGDAEKVGDSRGRPIDYEFTIDGVSGRFTARLHLDEDTLLPLKRSITCREGGRRVVAEESYASVTLTRE